MKNVWRGLRFYEITCRERRLGSFVAASSQRRAVKLWHREHPELPKAKLTVKRLERHSLNHRKQNQRKET